MAKTQTLNISTIHRPSDLQIRESLRTDHIEDLVASIDAGDELPPVEVVREGNAHWLVDGHHRVKAYEEAGVRSVPATIVQDGTRQDARWLACAANMEHTALKRSNADKRRAVEAALTAAPKKSDNAIAEHCGVSHTFVQNTRKSLATVASEDGQRETADGRKMDTSNIGKGGKKAGSKGSGNGEKDDPQPTGAYQPSEDEAGDGGSQEAEQPDPVDEMAGKAKAKPNGSEQVTVKQRREAYSALGKVVRCLQDLGKLAPHKSTLNQVADEIKPPKD